jgi:VWFA-related protein
MAMVVFACAFAVGREILVSDSPTPPRPPRVTRPGAPPRSGDDAGFSITLAKPDERYLIGRQTIVIDPTVPSGDLMAQVDFFVDGRLVCTSRERPYVCESDFGPEIARHTIIVTAVTRSGRRAKVSLISRSGDVSESAGAPLVMIPAVVLDGQGRPVVDLSVSDFTLLENGARRPIVHFDSEPWPASIAVVVDASRWDAAARAALLRGAAALPAAIPAHYALAFVESGRAAPPPRPADAERPVVPLEFSYDRDAFARRLSESEGAGEAPAAGRTLAEALASAAEGLKARPAGGRVLLALIAEEDLSKRCQDAAPNPAAEAAPRPAEPPADDPALAAAIDRLKRAGAVIYLIVLGGDGEGGPLASLRRAPAETGGDLITFAEAGPIAAGSRRVADYLLQRYLLSYVAEDGGKPGPRTIEVRARCAGCQVRARQVLMVE